MPSHALTLVVLLAAPLGAASRSRSGASPVQEVVSLLTGLESKIKRDGAAEEKAYEAYMTWCKDGGKDKEFEIKTAKSNIEDLTATIGKADADSTALTTKIEELSADISTNEADLKAATQIREKELAEFTAAEKELEDAVSTLSRAINVLERKMHSSALLQAKVDRRDVAKLLHVIEAIVDAAALSIHDRKTLLGLVQSGQGDEDDAMDTDVGAPDPAAYKQHSEGIIDVLEDLKQKASTQLEELRQQENTARHNFDLLKQSLQDQISVDQKEFDEAKASKHDTAEVKAVAEQDLAVSKKDLAEDEGILASMKDDCAAKAADHQATVKSRAEELQALAEAKKAIMASTGGAEEVVYGTPASFLQLSGRDKASRSWLANFEVVNFVRRLAREQRSTALAQLAGQISNAMRLDTGDDPFAKVKALIAGMIEKLMNEAGADANHKAYCDKEYGETKQKVDELKYDTEKYSSKLDKIKSNSATLKEEVAALLKEIAYTIKSQADADKMRQEEYKIYVQTKADLEQGLKGVRMALKILREYYANDESLVQQVPEAPEAHSKSSGAGSGVISMLEVIESDFGKTLASTEMNEDAAATAYEKLSMENKMAKAMKEQDVQFKQKESGTLDKTAMELASDLDSTQTELDAVLEYSSRIRAMCEVKPESYEDRKAHREAELAGLKEALQILDGEAVLLQGDQRQPGLRGAAVTNHLVW